MLLVMEIMLTISAWKKGWKGFALLPLALVLLLAASLGQNVELADSFALGLGLDIVCIVVLLLLNMRQSETKQDDEENILNLENDDSNTQVIMGVE